MATAWPSVVGWLLTNLPNLSGWSSVVVIDGPPVEAILPDDYVTVGFASDGTTGSLTLDPDPDGFSIVEVGDVRCELACVTEQVDLATMRARVFGLFDSLAAAVKANRRLGNVLSPQGFATLTVDPQVIVNSTGTSAALVFSLNYTSIT